MRALIPDVERLAELAGEGLAAKNVAREASLGRCRDAIRNSANAIRAVHRGDFGLAEELSNKAGTLLAEAKHALRDHQDIRFAGFVHDSEKEYAEARLTLAFIANHESLPRPADIDVELPAYLNGLGEAVGELRRYLLDTLRSGDVERCEECLSVMDEVYGILVTFDYPDAMTGGLRRTTDNVRGILERTRGDLSLAVRQRDLEQKLARFEDRLT
ncbi:MAG TPA: haloacid dehalogenase [Dehalococcoidia bacterium]|jgi:translin|nr:haloacid dehalogenase [Dehalococcoidia bacterium]